MLADPIPLISDVQQAKAIIQTVWVLAKALKWPLQQGATAGFAWWRKDSEPLLAIYAGGTRWADRGTGEHSDAVNILGVVENKNSPHEHVV